MSKSQFLLGAFAQRFDFVVLQDEIAVWAQQVVSHQVGIM